MAITIYHNPACGTSRNTLAMIRQSGEEPRVIEYLIAPPSRQELVDLVQAMGISVRDLLRRKGTPYDALGLDDPKWTDDQLIDFSAVCCAVANACCHPLRVSDLAPSGVPDLS